MKDKKQESRNLVEMKNFLDYNKKINKEDNTFQKLMVLYKMAIKELNTKVEIIKEEYKLFYNYDLIDHINFRIKEPDSIIKKMKNKECKLTYKEMIENINDIAGIRIVCSLKKDIFSIKNLLQKLPGVRTIKEKDYVTNPKKSGYSAYHIILGIPVVLSQQIIYVKVGRIKEKFMNINEKIGLNIRKYREEQGYTQNDFAEECQISRAYY